MSLRSKTILYLVAVHLVFAAAAVYFLWDRRVWLLGVEAVFAVSIVVGVRLVNGIFGPLELIRTGVQFLNESDFNSRFREVGQPEMDELTRVYNRMADSLREERVRAREQHHFLDEIIKVSPSGIVIFDFDERISGANPAAERIFRMEPGLLAGKRLDELEGPFPSALARLTSGEAQILPLEGNRRVKCVRSHFLDRGFPRSFLMIEELTEELRRAEKAAYEKIIRMMSHEINNSVGASNSLLESCLNYKDQLSEDDRGDFETALNVAISRNRHLDAFMKGYADVIRLPRPEPRPCDVQRLLEDIAFLMRAESRRRSIVWNWDVGERLQPVAMDKNQVEQVFLNVIKNAMEAIGECGAITIRIGRRSGRPFVAVEDSGHGITDEVRANLFTPFFTTKENGRGIGLTLVQEILSRHGFSFSLGGGSGQPTQFAIYF